jgi:NADH-quinone oxidoreductase subunit G
MPIAKLSELDRVLIIGSFLRKDQPIIAARIRTAAKRVLQVMRIDAGGDDWLIPSSGISTTPSAWLNSLSEVALAVAKAKSVVAPTGIANVPVSPAAQKIADSLISGSTKAVLLGSAAIAHRQASDLHVLVQFIAEHTGSTLGFLPVGGNAVGAALVNANGAGVDSVLSGNRKAVLLMNIEPDADLPNPVQARAALVKANTVIALSAYKSADLLARIMRQRCNGPWKNLTRISLLENSRISDDFKKNVKQFGYFICFLPKSFLYLHYVIIHRWKI